MYGLSGLRKTLLQCFFTVLFFLCNMTPLCLKVCKSLSFVFCGNIIKCQDGAILKIVFVLTIFLFCLNIRYLFCAENVVFIFPDITCLSSFPCQRKIEFNIMKMTWFEFNKLQNYKKFNFLLIEKGII